jgi:hypothetical protein
MCGEFGPSFPQKPTQPGCIPRAPNPTEFLPVGGYINDAAAKKQSWPIVTEKHIKRGLTGDCYDGLAACAEGFFSERINVEWCHSGLLRSDQI